MTIRPPSHESTDSNDGKPVTGRTSDSTVSGNRRWFLRIAGGALLAGAGSEAARRMGVFEGEAANHELVSSLETATLDQREMFARDYLSDPNLSPERMEQSATLFVQNELIRYLKRNPDNTELDHTTFQATVYEPFMNGVSDRFSERQQKADPTDSANPDTREFSTPSVALIANAKLALHDQIGNEQYYFGENDNIIDPMMTAEMQCRSGSRLLLLALYRNVADKLQPDEKLVVIYSNTHMQTGLLTANGRVIAFEMTKSGKGIQDLGQINQITRPVQILDAGHDLAQAAINRKTHPEQSVLLDTVPDGYTSLDSIFDKTGEFGGGCITMPSFNHGIGGSKNSTTDQYGFADGTVEIPSDRKPITPADYLPINLSTSRETGRGGETSANQNTNGVYDTLQSAEDTMGVDIASMMTSEEKMAIAEFEQHSAALSPDLNEIASSYKLIMRDRNADVRKELEDIFTSGRRLTAYMDANGIDAKHASYEAALKSFHGRHPEYRISFPRNPREYLISVLEHLKQLSKR